MLGISMVRPNTFTGRAGPKAAVFLLIRQEKFLIPQRFTNLDRQSAAPIRRGTILRTGTKALRLILILTHNYGRFIKASMLTMIYFQERIQCFFWALSFSLLSAAFGRF